ncbi:MULTISPECIES: hypothetical protein [Kosakonia]|uniref:hypothetical protein n=1 Tax=Kosakonia TaxID=1330547 RepID=UPI000A6489AE|nr:MULTISPECIES: hypothetical protein [Kosakonia]RCW99898.1 hypothetical protein DFO56_107236 [Kosakonia sp. AG348]
MRNELKEQVMLERVELIARLTTEGMCRERDLVIALNWIEELAKDTLLKNKSFWFSVSDISLEK